MTRTIAQILLLAAIAVARLSPVLAGELPLQAEEGTIQLTEDYVAELIYSPPLSGLGRIVRSQSGLVFFKHSNAAGGIRVSRLDVDQNQATTVLDLPPRTVTTLIVGGPGDSFFIGIDTEIRQVNPDGSFTVWGPRGGADPWYYTPDGHMLGISGGETKVVEVFSDGSVEELVTGLSLAYDVVADDTGSIFIADFMANSLIRLDPGSAPITIAEIAADNTDLTIDSDGNLYLNNAASGFAQVDKSTGTLSPMRVVNAPCQIVQSPADVVFDNSGRAIFAAWVASRLTWADFGRNTGGELLHQPWANSGSTALGPDGALYIGVDGCGTTTPSEVVKFTIDGSNEIYVDGLAGKISDIAFDSGGGLYVGLTTETNVALAYFTSGSASPSVITVPAGFDIGSLAVDTVTDRLYVSAGLALPTYANVEILEFTPMGLQRTYTVDLPTAVMELSLAAGPGGTLFAFATEMERFMTGPEVSRWILRLNLGAGTSEVIAQINRIGCCPMGSFSVDFEGYGWWILNPEFLLYKVSLSSGTTTLFAENLPIDAGSAHRNSDGDIYLNTPEGIFRIWRGPTCGDDNHPYPTGDLNQDCRVDCFDMAILCSHWLEDNNP